MKKTVSLLLIALVALALFAGCANTTEKKSEYQITVFADAALETALTEVAKAYTNSEKNPNANKEAEVLFNFNVSDKLKAQLDEGAYCDIFVPADPALLEGRELAGPAALTISSGAAEGGEAGAVYYAALLNMSDRQAAAQAFLDYLKSAAAKEIFEANGLTAGS